MLFFLSPTAGQQCSPHGLPFQENFDTTANGWIAGSGASNTGDAINACWKRQPDTPAGLFWGVGSGVTKSCNTGPSGDHTTGSSNFLYTENENVAAIDSAWIQTPAIDLTGSSNPGLRFYYHMYGTNSAMGTLFVEVTSDGGNSWEPLYQREGPDQKLITASWKPVKLDLSLYSGDTISLRFGHLSAGEGRADVALDDVEISTCLRPDQFSANFTGNDSAMVSWQSALPKQGGEWLVEWDTSGFTPGNGNKMVIADTFAALSGLDTATGYEAYMAKICGNDTTAYSEAVNFATSFSIPYSENFDGGKFPVYWNRFPDSNGPVKDTCGGKADALNIAGGEMATTPALDASDAQSVQFSYDWGSVCGTTEGAGTIYFEWYNGNEWITAKAYDQAQTPVAFERDSFTLTAAYDLPPNLRFRARTVGDTACEWQIDSLVIEQGPSCPDSLPYVETFTGNIFPDCWERSSLSDISLQSTCGTKSNVANIAGKNALTTHLVNAQDLQSLTLAYDWGDVCGSNEPEAGEHLYVEWYNGQEWQIAKAYEGPESPDTFERDSVVLSNRDGLPATLRFRFRTNADVTSESWQVDSIVIKQGPDCPMPSGIQLAEAGMNTTEIAWKPGSGSEWLVEWDSTGFSPGTGDTAVAQDTFATIAGLDAGATYDLYVREVCGNDTSGYAGPLTFCTNDSLDHSEAFSQGFPTCWYRSSDSEVAVEASCGSRANVLNLEGDQTATSSEVDASGVQSVKIAYYWGDVCNEDTESDDKIHFEWYDGDQWVTGKSFSGGASSPSSFERDSLVIANQNSLPQNLKFRIRTEGSGGDEWQVDSVVIVEGPACSDSLTYREDFPDGNFPLCWERSSGAQASIEAACGSGTNVLDIAETNQIVTNPVDAGGARAIKVSYDWGAVCSDNDLEGTDSIYFQWYDGSSWKTGKAYDGDMASDSFERDSFVLADSNQLTSQFRVRIRTNSNVSTESFQVDSLMIEESTACPGALPYTEDFAGGHIPVCWSQSSGTEVLIQDSCDARGNVLDIFSSNHVTTDPVDASGVETIRVSYYWGAACSGDDVEDGDSLYFEWYDGSDWKIGKAYNGDMASGSLQRDSFVLADPAKLTPDFKLRIRTVTNVAEESWQIDSLVIKEGPDCPDSLPYTEDFTDGDFPMCWTRAAGSEISIQDSCGGRGNVLEVISNNYVTTNPVDVTGVESVKISWYWGAVCSGNGVEKEDTIYFDWYDGSDWVTAKAYDGDETPNGFERDSFVLKKPGAITKDFKVRVRTSTNFSTESWQIDSLVIEEGPDCPSPFDLQAVSKRFNKVQIAWRPVSGNEWQVEWDGSGFTPGNGDSVGTLDTLAAFSGLTPNSTYDFYVAGICGAGDTSDHLGPLSVTTDSVIDVPFAEDFDNAGNGWISGSGSGNSGDRIDHYWNRKPSGHSSYFWSVRSGATPFENSGPSQDHTTGNDNYLYTEAPDGNSEDSAIFTSPAIGLASISHPRLSFWHHMYGKGIGALEIQVSNDGGSTWNVVDSIVGEQQMANNDPWKAKEIDLFNYGHDTVTIRFLGIKDDNAGQANIAIDGFKLFEPDGVDVMVRDVIAPKSGQCGEQAMPVTVVAEQKGIDTLQQVTLGVNVTGATQFSGSETFNTSMVENELDTLTFSALNFDGAKGGKWEIKAINQTSGDAVGSNDTVHTSLLLPQKPNSPTVKAPTLQLCGPDTATMVATASASVYWTSGPGTSTPLAQGDSLVQMVDSSQTFYAYAKNSEDTGYAGAPDNSIGEGGYYKFADNGLRFDVKNAITIDSVTVYTEGAGTVQINVEDKNANPVDGKSVNVTSQGKKRIPVGISVPVGKDYTIHAEGSDVGLFRNVSGTSYPYQLGEALSITDGTISGRYYFFYNWQISHEPCESEPATVQVEVLNPPQASIEPGTPFEGRTGEGNMAKPDSVCTGNALNYTIAAPSGFSNSDFGTGWDVTSVTVQTMEGTSANDFTFSNPAAGQPGMLTFNATAGDADSMYKAEIIVKDLSKGCDTALTRFIQVLPTPSAGYVFGNSTTSLCLGDAMNLKDTSELTGSGTLNHDWGFGDGNSSSAQNPAYAYASPGTYDVKLRVKTIGGCEDSVKKQVTVNDTPDVAFTAPNVCEGEAVKFPTNSSAGSGSISSYEWEIGDSTYTAKSPSHQFTNAGAYNVKLLVTTDGGCADSLTKAVTVNEVPEAAFSVSDVCFEDTMEFLNQSQYPFNDSLHYTWAFGDNDSSHAKAPEHVYDQTGNYTVELIAKDTVTGCMEQMQQSVSVYKKPEAAFSVEAVCEGADLSIKDQTQFQGTGFLGHEYTVNGDTIEGGQNPVITDVDTGQYNIKSVVTSANGCSSTHDSTIEIDPAPEADFNIPADVCAGDTVSFENATAYKGFSDSLDFKWDFGNEDSSASKNPEYIFGDTGAYSVSLFVNAVNGCTDSLSKKVQVNPVLSSDFDFLKKGGGTVAFEVADTTGIGYEWDFGDGNQANQINPQHVYDSNGVYKVSLTTFSKQGCTGIATDSVALTSVGIEEPIEKEASFLVYPNPCQGKTTIQYELTSDSEVRLAVYNNSGQRIQQLVNGKQTTGTYKYLFGGSHSAGIYIVRLVIDGKAQVKRLVKNQ